MQSLYPAGVLSGGLNPGSVLGHGAGEGPDTLSLFASARLFTGPASSRGVRVELLDTMAVPDAAGSRPSGYAKREAHT